MFLFPRAASVPAVPATLVRPALLLSLPVVRNAESATNLNGNGAVLESRQSSSESTMTTTGLPNLLIAIIVVAVLIVLILAMIFMYWGFRIWRDRKKRSEYYNQKMKYQDLASKGLRPDWGAAAAAPIPVSFPFPHVQATLPPPPSLPPLVPNRAYAV